MSDTGANLQPAASNSSSTFAKHHAHVACRSPSPSKHLQGDSYPSINSSPQHANLSTRTSSLSQLRLSSITPPPFEETSKAPSGESCSYLLGYTPPQSESSSSETPPKDLMQISSHCSLSDDGYRPEFPKTHAEFKSFIIRHIKQVGWVYCAINYHLCFPRDIPVMSYRGQTYRMKPSGDPLRHTTPKGQGPGTMTFFRQIRQKGGDVFPSSSALKMDPSFYALGFLVEPSNEKAGRETNYVWAINISTKPWSLWLIYDYVSWGVYGTKPNNDVRQIYKKTSSAERGLSYTYDRLESPYLGLERDWDMLKVFDDFDSWDPDNPCRVTLSDAQHECLGPSLRAYQLLNPHKRAVSTSELSQASSA
ncbi:MAG: hypothetical protein Q9199_001894 [Rusavskia elegans]